MQPEQRTTGADAAPLDRDAYRFLLLHAHDPRVLPIRQYIRDQFARRYGARIRDFMPLQLAMARGDAIRAAAGLRCAADEPLFVEQYLDGPCELELVQRFGVKTPARPVVAEVGNLAATESGAARELFVHIAAVARGRGLQWLLCNATPRVQAIFRHMHLPFARLREADRGRVTDPESWGSYYDQPSHVMAAPVTGIIDAMLTSDPFRLAFAECRARSAPSGDVVDLDPGDGVINGPVPLARQSSIDSGATQ